MKKFFIIILIAIGTATIAKADQRDTLITKITDSAGTKIVWVKNSKMQSLQIFTSGKTAYLNDSSDTLFVDDRIYDKAWSPCGYFYWYEVSKKSRDF